MAVETRFTHRNQLFGIQPYVVYRDVNDFQVHWSLVWHPKSKFSRMSPCPVCGFGHSVVKHCTILRDEWNGKKNPGIGRARAALKKIEGQKPYSLMFEGPY